MQEYIKSRINAEEKIQSADHIKKHTTSEPTGEYRINLSVFEGPIDLLFYLIKKNELDIHEVSLAQIAKEYLEYVELIKLIDLEKAGDFIVIASTLMKIKSRSLFSKQDSESLLTDENEVRQELIKYLLEYQKLGGAAEKLAEKEALRHGIYPRGGERKRILDHVTSSGQISDYLLFDLLTAFRDVLATAPKTEIHQVELLNITSEMKQREIMDLLKQNGKIEFLSLVERQPRLIIVVTFIAMLELIKAKKIRIRQTNQFGRILLYERTDNSDTDN
ncbi:MAG: segregation/condensation protein A [Candidatus Latescibacteria bacterium]|nr:segregation/condensation protein A [Candidatus Latescibacterota bacterium]